MNNTLPKILVVVHLAGQSCEMIKINQLSKEYGFSIIEDASHAIGGKYHSRPIGSGLYSDITVFSFHPVKIITTGEGGVAVTNSQYLHERMSVLRSHGITRDEDVMVGESHGPWYYQQVDLGFNYRMTDIQAALGLSQLKNLDGFVTERNKQASKYNYLLQGIDVTTPFQAEHSYSSFHLYIIKFNALNLDFRKIFCRLREEGIGVNVHYIPIYLQPYYQQFGFKSENFPIANGYYQSTLSLPIFPGLTETEQMFIVNTLDKCILEQV